MQIAIIDADLISRRNHRFPNLACMKLSGYYKLLQNDVTLKTNFEDLKQYDKVFISKVFTDTEIPQDILNLPNVEYGGTGFYYDKAPKLPDEIEHTKPDYHLYDEWVTSQLKSGAGKKIDYKYYTDYSIGFLTRGCFRHCPFCVNKNYNKVMAHSNLSEFYDPNRKKICLLDDNFLGFPDWLLLLNELKVTKKPFQFKQGLDERLLDVKKCHELFTSKYDGDFIFAFDNIADSDLIIKKLKLIRKYTDKMPKFYVFTGFDRNNKWDAGFWKRDIWELLERIRILMSYNCLPYVMRFSRYLESPYQGVYKTISAWCNQPSFFKKLSLTEFAKKSGGAREKYIIDFLEENKQYKMYAEMKFKN